MDHADWLNDAVHQEVEALQGSRGFEENEAVAFWHPRQAEELMGAMWDEEFQEGRDRQEQRGGEQRSKQPGFDHLWARIDDQVAWHTSVKQHLWALRKPLALRVLRRDYPDGWG